MNLIAKSPNYLGAESGSSSHPGKYNMYIYYIIHIIVAYEYSIVVKREDTEITSLQEFL